MLNCGGKTLHNNKFQITPPTVLLKYYILTVQVKGLTIKPGANLTTTHHTRAVVASISIFSLMVPTLTQAFIKL